MSFGRWIALALTTFVFAGAALLLHGLVSMGDCYPEEPVYSICLAGQARTGRMVLIAVGLGYALTAWLLVRPWRPR